jgi:glycosyltransferase involved in cell wall biosynthesis
MSGSGASFGAPMRPAPDQSLRISVVIPHLNQPEMLRRCLASLWNGRRQPDQVIVVDNGSTQLPEAVVSSFPGTILLQEPTPGPGPARNRGVAFADGDVLAFIDADCLADPLWLMEADSAMKASRQEVLGGDVRISIADPNQLTLLEAYECVYAYRMDRYIAEQGFTGTGNLAVSREILDHVGPFAGLSVAEDRDWGHRATELGYRFRFVEAMCVYHPARQNFNELYTKWDRQLAHDYAMARRKGIRGRFMWVLKTLALPVSAIFEIPRIINSDRISGSRSRAFAFLGLARIRIYRMRRMAWLMTGGNPDTLSRRWNRPNARNE